MSNSLSIAYICVAAVFIVGLTQCGARTNPEEVKAIAEACAKVGKEPSIVIRSGEGIRMGCKEPQPAQPSN